MMEKKSVRRQKRRKQQVINGRLRKTLLKDSVFDVCCYCNHAFLGQDLTIEHIVPICLGGSNELHNIALACAPCNQARGREVWLARRKLIREIRGYGQQNG